MNNPNHPKKGSSIKVQPIRQKAAIDRIKAALLHAGKYRDFCLFTLGINTAYRANELLSITLDQVSDLVKGDTLEIKQSKNKKHRLVTINGTAADAISLYLARDYHIQALQDLRPEAPLFYSQRGDVLTVPTLTNMVKDWCAGSGLRGNYGSHTMRKTWGYWQYKNGNAQSLARLMIAFGHSSQEQTLAYLCIQDEEIRDFYDMEL